MKSTIQVYIFTFLRLLMGLTLLIFGLNGFLEFYPLPDTTPEAKDLLGSLWKSGYLMHLEKTIEFSVGLLLLLNRWVPLALLVFFPIAINIALIDTLLQPQYWYYGGTIFIINLLLLIQHQNSYQSILKYKHALYHKFIL